MKPVRERQGADLWIGERNPLQDRIGWAVHGAIRNKSESAVREGRIGAVYGDRPVSRGMGSQRRPGCR